MNEIFKMVKGDIGAYADDNAEVVMDHATGDVVFNKGGVEIEFKLIENDGALLVSYQDETMSYTDFLTKKVAKLEILATKILSKRKGLSNYVDGGVKYFTSRADETELSGLEALNEACSNSSPFVTSLTFITADAGHGKTALLKEFQHLQAEAYLAGTTKYLFWHVDLQGRQLVRLNEAIMYDLGELRVSGLWMSSVINLILKGFLVLAIDGFDELAAEVGNKEAIGALSSLAAHLNGKGRIIAASRRTFFDIEDYVKRTKLMKDKLPTDCEFSEIKIQDWSESNSRAYIQYSSYEGSSFSNPSETYDELVSVLDGNKRHPVLSKPFLLAKVIEGLLKYNKKPSEFMLGLKSDNEEGVGYVVESFVLREVEDKWKDRETGEPFLSVNQHMALLTEVANIMWEDQVEFIHIDSIQYLTTILCEDWKFDSNKSSQIVEMVKMHALLVKSDLNKDYLRSFDHPEFKGYFIAKYLSRILVDSTKSGNNKSLIKFLSHSQLPDSIARFSCNCIDDSSIPLDTVILFLNETANQWKPTYLQFNVGTILPYLLNNYRGDTMIMIDSKLTFSSLVFENKQIENTSINNGTFINISLKNTSLTNVVLKNCDFNEIRIETSSENSFSKVDMVDCNIDSIKIVSNGEVQEHTFTPTRIIGLVEKYGINFGKQELKIEFEEDLLRKEISEFEKQLQRFLLIFSRTTSLHIHHINHKFSSNQSIVYNKIIPLLLKHDIIDERSNNTLKHWRLNFPLDKILDAENENNPKNIKEFWEFVRKTES